MAYNDIGFEVVINEEESCTVKLSGNFDKKHIKKIYSKIKKLKQKDFLFVGFDCSALKTLDYSGALVIADIIAHYSLKKASIAISHMDNSFRDILMFARKNLKQIEPSKEKKELFWITFLNKLGKSIYEQIDSFLLFLSFMGESVREVFLTIKTPWRYRYKATAVQIEKSGAKALPIVALTSFLVGLVIAYQGAEQLAKFGANIFIVDMVGISVFRELAPLIAAIVVAGRSSSSYTAEIGTMKITEEIDAMKTMGFSPILFLVLPRMFALILAMPLIVFFADCVGVFGGMIVADTRLGIGYSEFLLRLRDVLELKHVLIGLFKAPFFGFIIALIGCFRGFQVTGSTESIGRYTTISVVNAIFWVIACNALISVILTEIGI